MTTKLITILASIGLISLICQWLAWRIKLPAILFLILCGLLLGPTLGWLQPQQVFGQLLSPMISLSVAIILFEGSMTLNFNDIKGVEKVVRNLISIGLIISWLLLWGFSHYILGLRSEIACLFGAILTISGPTVVQPILRSVRPKATVTNILRWEATLIDPIGAILAVLIFTTISQAQTTWASTAFEVIEVVLIGGVGGALTGWLLGTIFRKYWLPEYLHNIATLAVVSTLFALTNHVEEGAGLLAVTTMGIWLANMKSVHIEGILNFKASLSILLISGLFLVLAADITFEALGHVLVPSILLFLAIQFIVRPIVVSISSWGSRLRWRERFLIGWISPRGIVCAAMAAIFSMQLTGINAQNAEALILVTFLIILFTVIFQSLSARPMAKLLRVSSPEPVGFLIVGANPFAQLLAQTLIQHDQPATIIDTNWQAIREARMKGIPVFYGNPVSEHTDRHLNLTGLGNIIALTPRHDLNTLSCFRFSKEFGKQHAYMLASKEPSTPEKVYTEASYRPNLLFGKDISFAKLASLVANGAQLKSTKLTQEFTLDDFISNNPSSTIPLLLVDAKGRLKFFLVDAEPQANPGDTLVSLSPTTT